MYWIQEYHIDGIRMDAVSNMLYLDYGTEVENGFQIFMVDHGNLEGIEFLKEVNTAVSENMIPKQML